MSSITHELKLGTLIIDFGESQVDDGDGKLHSMSASFELESSGEMYKSEFDDGQIRSLCPIFAEAPELVADALSVRPDVTVTDAMATVTFAINVFTRIYPIGLSLARVRITSESREIAELQKENIGLRTRVRKLEEQMVTLANICLPLVIDLRNYPGPNFETCLAISKRDKAEVINECARLNKNDMDHIISYIGGELTYDRLVEDGLDVNFGCSGSHNAIMTLTGRTHSEEHLNDLIRLERLLNRGLKLTWDSYPARATSLLGVVQFLQKNITQVNPSIRAEAGHRYRALADLIISKGGR